MHTRVADQLEGEYRYKESDSEEIRRRSTLEDGSLILSEGQTQQAFDAAAQQRLGSIDSAPLHTTDLPQFVHGLQCVPATPSAATASSSMQTPQGKTQVDSDASDDDVAPNEAKMARMDNSARKPKAKAKAKESPGGSANSPASSVSEKNSKDVNTLLEDSQECNLRIKNALSLPDIQEWIEKIDSVVARLKTKSAVMSKKTTTNEQVKLLDAINTAKKQLSSKMDLAKLLFKWDRSKTKAAVNKIDTKFQDMYCNEVKLEDVPFCMQKFTILTSVRALVLDAKWKSAIVLASDDTLNVRFQLAGTHCRVDLQGEIVRDVLSEYMLLVSQKKKGVEEVATEFMALILEVINAVNLVLMSVLHGLLTCCMVKKRSESLNLDELDQATSNIMKNKESDTLIQSFVNLSPMAEIWQLAVEKVSEYREKVNVMTKLNAAMEEWKGVDHEDPKWLETCGTLCEQADALLVTPLKSVPSDAFKSIHQQFQECLFGPVHNRILQSFLQYENDLKDQIKYSDDGKLTVTTKCRDATDSFSSEIRPLLSSLASLSLVLDQLASRAAGQCNHHNGFLISVIEVTLKVGQRTISLKDFLIDDKLDPSSVRLQPAGERYRDTENLMSGLCEALESHKGYVANSVVADGQKLENWKEMHEEKTAIGTWAQALAQELVAMQVNVFETNVFYHRFIQQDQTNIEVAPSVIAC